MAVFEYTFAVAAKVTAEANTKTGQSRMINCDVQLFADPEIEAGWRRKKDQVVNEAGLKAQTQGLVQGLVANIHWGHQMGYWDSAEHLRYVIEHLERGFAVANAEATNGEF